MAQAPSLSEITSIKGDANLAYGTQGVGGTDVTFDFNKGLAFMADAAQQRQRANQFKVELFQRNLENYYKNFNSLSVDGVMEADFPEITAEYAALARDLAEHQDVIRNPMKDPERHAQLVEREAALRGKIARSKQDVAYRQHHQDFLRQHPEFNNDENRRLVEGFSVAPLGARQYQSLRTPVVYNPTEIAAKARQYATQKLSEQKAKGLYLTTEATTKVMKDAYMEYWRGAHQAAGDKTGRSGTELARHTYDTVLSDEEKRALSFDQWLDRTGEQLMGEALVEQTSGLTPDAAALQKDQQKFQAGENAKDRAQRRWEFEYGKEEQLTPEELGRRKNAAWTMLLSESEGTGNPQMIQAVYGSDPRNQNDIVQVVEEEMVPNPNEALRPMQPLVPSGKKVTVLKPRIEVTGYGKGKDGNLVVYRKDNGAKDEKGGLGKLLPAMVVKPTQLYEDLDRMNGEKMIGKTSQGSRRYMELRIRDANGKPLANPEIGTMRAHFGVDENGYPLPGGGTNAVPAETEGGKKTTVTKRFVGGAK